MFNRPSISDYYRDIFEKIRNEILRENDATILGTDTKELAEYYFEKYSLKPIEINHKEITWDYQKSIKTIKAHERESIYQTSGDLDFPVESIKVEIPILQNQKIQTISGLQSSTYSLSYSEKDIHFDQFQITFSFEVKGYGFSYDETQVVQNLSSWIERAKQLVSWKNNDIEKENIQLQTNILKLISDRLQKIKQDESKLGLLTKMINIPLKQKINSGARSIELSEKSIISKVKPSPSQPEEYLLDQEKVLAIISFLDNQGKQFEKTPKSYESMGEESLRDVLLVNLNSIFEGKATGETFSKKGKSDIYLNIDKGNILVFECKIWGGKKLYHDTINQLESYLTWRHNFGIMITFSRNNNFSEVLKQIQEIISSSDSYSSGYRKINDTHYISLHTLCGDSGKVVEIHHLFYNLNSN